MKKYALTNETIHYYGKILHRIIALKSFGNVRKNDLGGFIEKEKNLSHEGDCWIYNNAKVFDNAKIHDNAQILGNSKIFGNAQIFDNVIIYEKAKIYDNAQIHENAEIGGLSQVYWNTQIYGNVHIYDFTRIGGNAKVFGNSKISDKVIICEDSEVSIDISGNAFICGNAKLHNIGDYILFYCYWNNEYLTWTKSNNMYKTNYFYGNSNQLISKCNKLDIKNYQNIINYIESL